MRAGPAQRNLESGPPVRSEIPGSRPQNATASPVSTQRTQTSAPAPVTPDARLRENLNPIVFGRTPGGELAVGPTAGRRQPVGTRRINGRQFSSVAFAFPRGEEPAWALEELAAIERSRASEPGPSSASSPTAGEFVQRLQPESSTTALPGASKSDFGHWKVARSPYPMLFWM